MSHELLTKSDYQELMQNPGVYLTDPNLKKCQVEKDPNGIPRVRSGGLALTYKLLDNNNNLALRCFHKVSPRREQHYAAISSFLSTHPSSILVSTTYQPYGIRYKGGSYPITLMDWIEGCTLGTFVFKNFNNQKVMLQLTGKFLKLVDEMISLKIAHGDLSHSNIMVKNGNLMLIDYDGMYVPELRGSESVELGNRSFQHPGRNEKEFGPEIDRFSEIVIYLALKAISISPSIYQIYGTGREGLLFAQSDFIAPDSSDLINDLDKITGLKELIRIFKRICQSDVSNIPSLNEFINNATAIVSLPKSTTMHMLTVGDFPLDARKMGELLEKETESVVVIGKIDAYHNGTTCKGDPYAFLNVGVFPRQTFTVVIWSETLTMLQKAGMSPQTFENSFVSVSGVISRYDGKPQIVLESPADIAIISYADAIDRLNRKKRSTEKPTSNTVINDPISVDANIPSKCSIRPNPMESKTGFSNSVPQQKEINEVLNRLYGPNSVLTIRAGTSPVSANSHNQSSYITTPNQPNKNPQSANINTKVPVSKIETIKTTIKPKQGVWEKIIGWIKAKL